MTFSVNSAVFIRPITESADQINMAAELEKAGMWLVLEGFTNGYTSTEDAVDALHLLIHNDLATRLADEG